LTADETNQEEEAAKPGLETRREQPMGQKRIKIDLLIHDLKVPLAVIEAGITSLLNRQDKYGAITESQQKVLRRVLRNTKVTQTLVNDALELGRSRTGMINAANVRVSYLVEHTLVEIFDLADCSVSDQIKTCRDLNGLQEALKERGVSLLIEEQLWRREVCLDEVKVRQILRNLLNNALKYRKRQVTLEVGDKDGQFLLSVADDGEGIPAAYHQKIFESYFQVDDTTIRTVRGHGLGLAGVMVLVEDMGGKLILESDAGKGAKFLVRVPLTTNP
jgi:signal transduction histidine kinase